MTDQSELSEDEIKIMEATEDHQSLRDIGSEAGMFEFVEFTRENAGEVKNVLEDLTDRGFLEKYNDHGYVRYRVAEEVDIDYDTALGREVPGPRPEEYSFSDALDHFSGVRRTLDGETKKYLRQKIEEEIISEYGWDPDNYVDAFSDTIELLEHETRG